MNKLIALNLLCVLFTPMHIAQTINWGPEIKTKKSFSPDIYESLELVNNIYYSIEFSRSSQYGIGLKGVSKDFEEIDPVYNIAWTEIHNKDAVKGYIQGDNVQIFNHHIEYEEGKSNRKFDLITKNTIALSGDSEIKREDVLKIEVPKNHLANVFGDRYLELAKSPTNKYLAYINGYHNYQFTTHAFRIGSVKIGEQLTTNESIATLKFQMFKGKMKYFLHSIDVLDDGTSLALILEKEKNKDYSVTKLYVHNAKGELLSKQDLVFDGKYLNKVQFEITEENEIFIHGNIAKVFDNKEGRNVGFFIGKLNTTDFKVKNFKEIPYEEKFFNELGYTIKNNGILKFKGFFELDVELRENGTGYLIANHSGYALNKEIIIYPIDKELNISSPSVILRSVEDDYPNANGMKYFSFFHNDELNFLYADHVKNIDVIVNDEINTLTDLNGKNSAIYLATLNKKNELNCTILAKSEEYSGSLKTERCILQDGNIILYTDGDKAFRYGMLSMP